MQDQDKKKQDICCTRRTWNQAWTFHFVILALVVVEIMLTTCKLK